MHCRCQNGEEILIELTLPYVFACVWLAISQSLGVIQPSGFTVILSKYMVELGGQKMIMLEECVFIVVRCDVISYVFYHEIPEHFESLGARKCKKLIDQLING
jgi:hypothetical protein